MSYDFVSNDTGSILQTTCVDSTNAAIDLTGSTVHLQWKDNTGTLQSKIMTIVTAASGIVKYQFAAGELIPGVMEFEVQITDSSGYITTNVTLISLTIREEVG